MNTTAERTLSECIAPQSPLREIEAHIYCASPDGSLHNTYDTDFGSMYEWVAAIPSTTA
jgi:hypothetical protein